MNPPLRYGAFEVLPDADDKPLMLGEGTSGTTYKAVRRETVFGGIIETLVAVKVIKPGRLDSERQQSQFVRELQVLSQIRSNHVVRYLEQGESNGELYYAMEFCSGGDLGGFSANRGGLSPSEVIAFGAQAAEGLKAVHDVGFVHCDVKPANLLLDQPPGSSRPLVKLSDFGSVQRRVNVGGDNTAESLMSGEPFRGSPLFASPEQLRQHGLDQRSDIYSLGMTFWFLLLGRKPVDGGVGQIQAWHLDPAPHVIDLPATTPEGLVNLIAAMVQKDPGRRPSGLEDVLQALRPLMPESMPVPVAAAATDTPALDTLYQVDYSKPIKCPFGYRFPAVRRAGEEQVDLLFVHPEYASREQTESHLRKLEAASAAPDLPAGLLRVHGHCWFGDDLVVASDARGNTSLAAWLTERKIDVLFPADAIKLVSPLVEAIEHLEKHGAAAISLGLNDILLSEHAQLPAGTGLGTTGTDPALASFGGGYLAQLDPLLVPPPSLRSLATETHDSAVTLGATMVDSTGAEKPHVVSLAGLLYRLVVGLEVPDAAYMSVSAYTPTQRLGDQTNSLVREVLAGQSGSIPSCHRFLSQIIDNEDLRKPPTVQIARSAPPPFPKSRRGPAERTAGGSEGGRSSSTLVPGDTRSAAMRTGATLQSNLPPPPPVDQTYLRTAVPPPPPPTATQVPPPPPPRKGVPPPAQPAPVAASPAKSSGGKLVLVLVGAFVLLGILGGGGFLAYHFLLRGKASKPVVVTQNPPTTTTTTTTTPPTTPNPPPATPRNPPPANTDNPPESFVLTDGVVPNGANVRVNGASANVSRIEERGKSIDLKGAKWPCTITIQAPGHQTQQITLEASSSPNEVRAGFQPGLPSGTPVILLQVKNKTAEYQSVVLKRSQGTVSIVAPQQTDFSAVVFRLENALEGEGDFVRVDGSPVKVGVPANGADKCALPTGRYRVTFSSDRAFLVSRPYQDGKLLEVSERTGATVVCPPALSGTYDVVGSPEWKIVVQPGGDNLQCLHQEGQEWKMKGWAEEYKIDQSGVLTATVAFDGKEAKFTLTPGKTGQAATFALDGAPDDAPKGGDLKPGKNEGAGKG